MEDMKNTVTDSIQDSIKVKESMLASPFLLTVIDDICREVVNTLKGGGKVLFCGNGGSAADAQHIAAELSGRFYHDRDPLFAEALHVNTSYLTAVANDYSFEEVYSRLVKAKGREGDVLFGISTSGNSPNIIKAIETAKELGMITVGMTGESGGALLNLCQYLIKVPSSDTPRIQEAHILLGHIICEVTEKEMFE
ncbi:MAG: D-sedoheptulose 7-phosphate isomerase [Bacteroidetes bacterium]|nr:D-sedoheptulose 7-phosphate isomerase [Bacteroidota bacterium]